MIADEHLPDGWTARSETRTYDQLVDREFTRVAFERDGGEARVLVNEVEEAKDFEGWGYQVVLARRGAVDETRGVFEDLDAAREAALDVMEDHPG